MHAKEPKGAACLVHACMPKMHHNAKISQCACKMQANTQHLQPQPASPANNTTQHHQHTQHHRHHLQQALAAPRLLGNRKKQKYAFCATMLQISPARAPPPLNFKHNSSDKVAFCHQPSEHRKALRSSHPCLQGAFALYGTSRVAETASVSFTISCSLPWHNKLRRHRMDKWRVRLCVSDDSAFQTTPHKCLTPAKKRPARI